MAFEKLSAWSLKKSDKLKEGLKEFAQKISKETVETKEAAKIMQKYFRECSISEEEEKIFKLQLVDVLKVFGVMIPFVLIPGASILMPLIVKIAKKFNINILPSSFQN